MECVVYDNFIFISKVEWTIHYSRLDSKHCGSVCYFPNQNLSFFDAREKLPAYIVLCVGIVEDLSPWGIEK